LVALRDLLVPRRRRKPRSDGPKTIVPRPDTPAAKLDAARERLRREIPPPPADDD
jgi:hypothetical protein